MTTTERISIVIDSDAHAESYYMVSFPYSIDITGIYADSDPYSDSDELSILALSEDTYLFTQTYDPAWDFALTTQSSTNATLFNDVIVVFQYPEGITTQELITPTYGYAIKSYPFKLFAKYQPLIDAVPDMSIQTYSPSSARIYDQASVDPVSLSKDVGYIYRSIVWNVRGTSHMEKIVNPAVHAVDGAVFSILIRYKNSTSTNKRTHVSMDIRSAVVVIPSPPIVPPI